MSAPIPVASSPLGRFLLQLRLGEPVVLSGRVFVPLLAEGPMGPEAMLLEEALGLDATEVTEVARSEVNRVRVRHRGVVPLLLLDGEQIVGSMQDRVFNATFLVGPQSEVSLPVSCVEHGRWRRSTAAFASSGSTLNARARQRKLGRVHESLERGEGYDATQSEVWSDVAHYLTSSHVASRTGALEDGLRATRMAVDEAIAALPPCSVQVGIAMVRKRRLRLLDAFGSPSLFSRAQAKVLRGMLADAPSARPGDGDDALRVVGRTLRRVLAAACAEQPSPALGTTLHGAAQSLVFAATVHQDHTYHLVMAAP